MGDVCFATPASAALSMEDHLGRLLEPIAADARRGREELAAAVRQLVSQADPALSTIFAQVPDAALEPYLFQHLGIEADPVELAILLAGYAARCGRSSRIAIDMTSDETLFLPGLGYLATTPGHDPVDLVVDADAGQAWLERAGKRLHSALVPPESAGAIDVALISDRRLRRAFANEGLTGIAASVPYAAQRLDDLDLALTTLRAAWPELSSALDMVLRRIVLFASHRANSFASTREYGAIFLNVDLTNSAVGLVEDLAHQGGHTLFFAAAQCPEDYFQVSPSDPLCAHGIGGDTRTLYVALHGLVTEALMLGALDLCLSRNLFTGIHKVELIGRLAFVATRCWLDVAMFGRLKVLTPRCQALVWQLVDMLRAFGAHRAHLLHTVDLGGQPYNFDFQSFLEANSAATLKIVMERL